MLTCRNLSFNVDYVKHHRLQHLPALVQRCLESVQLVFFFNSLSSTGTSYRHSVFSVVEFWSLILKLDFPIALHPSATQLESSLIRWSSVRSIIGHGGFQSYRIECIGWKRVVSYMANLNSVRRKNKVLISVPC